MRDFLDFSLVKIRDLITSGQLTSEEVTLAAFEQIEATKDINALISLNKTDALIAAKNADNDIKNGKTDGLLKGVPIVVKDNISTKGLRTTCGSKFLENYVPPFDATVVRKLKEAGAVIVGKSNMDEFAMGSSNETSYFGPVKNPVDTTKVPGGSSGGSAATVAARQCYGSLGSDTGGSIRQPASFCGVVGLKPTYSAVSRYGLIAFASSLDQIGPFTRTIDDNRVLYNAICGYDKLDSTSSDVSKVTDDEISLKGKVIGVAKEYFSPYLNPEIAESFRQSIEIFEKAGAKIKEFSFKTFEAALATYYVLACAEAASNLARFDGVKYGHRAEADDIVNLYFNSRSEGFGTEVKRRIMTGNYVLSSGYYDAYYLKASKLRTMIKSDFEDAFSDCDIIISPTSPTTAFEFNRKPKSKTENYLADIYTVPLNIAGNCGISIPSGFDKNGLPIGLQLMGKMFDEQKLFAFAKAYSKAADLKI